MRTSLPRRPVLVATALVCLVMAPLMHIVLPHALSTLTPRGGWKAGRPAMWNLLGLIPIMAGLAVFLHAARGHVRAIPTRVSLRPTPNYLVRGGPYRYTRNPMYLAGLLLWLGWTLFYGSFPVLGGAALWVAATNFVIIPREERALEEVFSEEYRRYKADVPRWLWRGRRSSTPT